MHRKCFSITSKLFRRSSRTFPRVMGTLSLGIYVACETMKIFNSEELGSSTSSMDQTNNPTRIYEMRLSEPLPPGHVREVSLTLASGHKYTVLLMRTINGELYAMKSKCIYDDETELKNGLLIRDKMICPSHGCEYNVTTGEADSPMAYNSIPIFKVDEDMQRGTIGIYIPDTPPEEILPYFIGRNFDDFRKIAIIGTGAAGLGAAETLRRIGFTGEINMFTRETTFPFQKHNLTKFIDFQGKDKLLHYRTPSFYSDNQIKVIYSGEVRNVENSLGGMSYLQLKDDTKFLYDGLIVASGANEFSDPFSSDSVARNCVTMTNVYNMKKSQKLLENAKDVLLYNLTPEGLEFASTLKTHRPDLNVFYLSPTNFSILDREFTPAVSRKLIEVFKDRGVEFGLDQTKITQIRSRTAKDLITGYYLGVDKNNSRKVPLDVFYLFPSYDKPNIDFLSRLKLRNKIKVTRSDNIDVNKEQRTQVDNIFAAGSVSSWQYDTDGPFLRSFSWYDSFLQGENSAYSILSIRLGRVKTPFSYYSIFGKTLQKVGSAIDSDRSITVGSIRNLDFMTFYLKGPKIVGATGCGTEYNKRLMLMREAINLNYLMHFDDFEKDFNGTFEKLFVLVNTNSRASCFRSVVFDNRYEIDLEKLIWLEPEGKEIPNEESYANSRLSNARREEDK